MTRDTPKLPRKKNFVCETLDLPHQLECNFILLAAEMIRCMYDNYVKPCGNKI